MSSVYSMTIPFNTSIDNQQQLLVTPTTMEASVQTTEQERYTNLSLFIPRVHNSLRESDIRDIFNRLSFGEIKRVDVIIPGMAHDPHKEIEEDITTPPDPMPLFNMCFIHYSHWNNENATAQRFFEDVFVKDQEARIRYDTHGHFFKVFKNKHPKPDEQYELEQAFKKQQQIIQELKKKCSFYEECIDRLSRNQNQGEKNDDHLVPS